MPKRNTPRFKIRYKGRFQINKTFISTDIAYQFLEKCLKKPHFGVKTLLNIHDQGFHIGHSSGLRQVRKQWFLYEHISNYYIFERDRSCLVIIYQEKSKFYMSLVKFENELELKKLEDKMNLGTNKPAISNGGTENDAYEIHDEDNDNDAYEIHNEDNDKYDDNFHNDNDIVDYTFDEIDNISSSNDQHEDHEKDDMEIEEYLGLDHSSPNEYEPKAAPVQVTLREGNNSARMDNVNNSMYEDLFHTDVHENVEENNNNRNDLKRKAQIYNGSTYMFHDSVYVKVLDLYGTCESEDEDV